MIRTLSILLALAAVPLAAQTTVVLERDGIAVATGEVCRFRADDRDNPFLRWLASQEMTCVPAASPIEFPPGLWNVFARSRDAISSAPLLVDGNAPPRALTLELEPAAAVKPDLPPGATGVIYAPRRGSAFPVSRPLLVPADEELWLFVLEKSEPVALFPIPAIEAGSERAIHATSGGPSAVIGWLHVPESDRAALEGARGVSPPTVQGVSGVVTRGADALPPFARLHGALVRVRDVPLGAGVLTIGGRGWIPQRRGFNVRSGITVVDEPLDVLATGTLVVHWSADDDVVALEHSLGACDENREPPRFEISISACPPPERPGGSPSPAACSLVRQEPFDPNLAFGSITMDDVAPGVYRAEIRFGKLPPVSGMGTVRPLLQREVRLRAIYYEIYGSVTRGGESLQEDVALEFPGGYGFASRESGEYRAALLGMFGVDAKIGVAACDGDPHAIVLADVAARPNTRFEIDIPVNELTVVVSDTFTREPLAGATVKHDIISKRMPPRVVMSETNTTRANADGDARVVMTAVPEREIRLTVSHPGYQKQEVEPFSMTKSEAKRIDVQLVPLRGSRGTIVSPTPFDTAAVYWYSRDGRETEHADIAPDGTFVYDRRHSAEETMAVVSRSHPLWVLRSPPIDERQTVSLRFPDAPVRELEVSIDHAHPRDGRHIGIVIGGVRVPQPVLRQHQTFRRLVSVIRGSGPLHVRDLLETGPIDVLLGPIVEQVSPQLGGMDLFALPPFADAPRQRLAPGAKAVRFELK